MTRWVDQTCSSRWSPNLGALQEELQLLDDGTQGAAESFEHEVKTAPLFTRDAKLPAGFCPHKSQYGLLGSLTGIRQVSPQRVEGARSSTPFVLLGTKRERKFRWTLGCMSTPCVFMSGFI